MHLLPHFLCSGFEYKESKMEKRAYCGLGAKIPGAWCGSWRRTAPALRVSCIDLDLHHLTGSFCLRRGCVASRGGFPVVRGTGRPAGSRYLRLGGVLPEVATSVWGASCRKSLPPLGGVLPEVATSVWGASCRKSLPPLGGALPEGVPLLGEGASRSGYFVFCEMPVMRLMTKSCCSSVTTLSQ